MKSLLNRRFVIAILTVTCLVTVLVAGIRSSFSGAGDYDPWLDVNDDDKIDMKDVGAVARAVFTNGSSITKASVEYDSGWIDITDKCEQNIIITHDLNSTDLIVDIQGKISLDSGPHQRNYGLTGVMLGWNKTYGRTARIFGNISVASNDWAEALVQTSDGGYALVGTTENPFYVGDGDFWLVKTDASGNMVWNWTYGGTGDDQAHALVRTSDGGYALAGCTNSSGAGNYDFWLVKTDANGTMQWNQTYGGTNDDWPFALVQTSDGGYALAGLTYSFGAGSADFWLVKTDASGNVGGVESGLAWIDSSANTVTLYRGATDTSWNYVRVRMWKPR